MYGEYHKSLGAKAALIALHAAAIGASAWILFGGGFEVLFGWTRQVPAADQVLRRAFVFCCAAIYFARVAFGAVHLYKRKVSYGEAIGIGLYCDVIHVLFAFLGRIQARPLGWVAYAGVALYVLGSFLNTDSEYLRYLWKERPENKGRLYTGGLFRYSRHVNYFGDELLFIGYALIAGSGWGLIIPALMACGFIFVNIPMLDGYLQKKYGGEFEAYARHTKKFVPFVY